MLLQFAVENFRSFSSEVVLSMLPAKSRRQDHKAHVLQDEKGRRVKALPMAALYGANASGKSNLVEAISFAKQMIVSGTKGEAPIRVVPFRLARATRTTPSRFEFVLKHDGVLYTYGFKVSNSRVEEEWLFGVLNKKEVRLFERVNGQDKATVELGNQLAPTASEKRVLDVVARTTRPNQLFLTEANERNVEKLKPLMRWFRDNLQIVTPTARYRFLELRAHTDKEFLDSLGQFLQQADTGIAAVTPSAESVDLDKHFPGIASEIQTQLADLGKEDETAVFVQMGNQFFTIARDTAAGQGPALLSLRMRHRTAEGETVDFDSGDESDGTCRLMHFIPALLDLEQNDHVYVIDELDRSMHPLLCKLLVETFLQGVIRGRSNGQLIVTTHQTSLLDLDLLRRDEIWFIEKDQGGSSRLTSLAEYKIRGDLRVDNGYLNGRFGGIPVAEHLRVV
ncbi:MAG: ATP/GTP-binding protein [Kiritimatiellae bacterium]|nr:ATP/GTP-binding protein [Kiritimatiellia bacterium]